MVNRSINKKYNFKKKEFINLCNTKLIFNHRDLFTSNISSWLHIFNKFSLFNKRLMALEIGSFEGRSSFFLLKNLKKINLTCVDTFKPFHELQKKDEKKFTKIYKNFKVNTSKYSERLRVVKSTSSSFFSKNKKNFDLIYVDGSHKYKDVLYDSNEAFKSLNKDGIIIFDDFLWLYEKNLRKTSTFALLNFLYENNNNLKILYSNYQLIIKKN